MNALVLIAAMTLADFKAGYVDVPRALKEVNEGQALNAKLEKEAAKRKAELEAEQNKLRADKELLDKQSATMNAEAREQKSIELQKRVYDLAQKAERQQLELQQLAQSEFKKVYEKMDPILVTIAQREGLTMVFDRGNVGLVYAPQSLDLTNELVRTYDEKYKVAKK
jgi:outer membrane protein